MDEENEFKKMNKKKINTNELAFSLNQSDIREKLNPKNIIISDDFGNVV